MKLGKILLNLLYPSKCALCGQILEGDGPLCPACGEEAAWFSQGISKGTWGRCAGALHYDKQVRAAIHDYKFHNQSWRAVPFGEIMFWTVREYLGTDFDAITWAPVSRKRLRERGYDQARLLAEELGRHLGKKPEVLVRKAVDTPAQSSLDSAAARRENARDVYAPAKGAAIRGRRVLLIDDILTTGSTLTACARVLLESGAETVDCAVLAVAGAKETGLSGEQAGKHENKL